MGGPELVYGQCSRIGEVNCVRSSGCAVGSGVKLCSPGSVWLQMTSGLPDRRTEMGRRVKHGCIARYRNRSVRYRGGRRT